MNSSIKERIRSLLRVSGVEVRRFDRRDIVVREETTFPWRLARLLKYYQIDTVLDVGANTGQYGRMLRQQGFAGRIVSFEPLSAAFSLLTNSAATDLKWEVHQLALGDRDGTAEINVAGNSQSSSLLDMLPKHIAALPKSAYVSKEVIELRKLDTLFPAKIQFGTRAFLKLDVQGYEAAVLRGASESLKQVRGLQLEMPLVNLYAGEASFDELTRFLTQRAFTMVAIEPGFTDLESGRVLQVDAVFMREQSAVA